MAAPDKSPLTDAQIEALDDLLYSLPDAMSLEMLDGFLAALICSPRLVMPSEYLPLVWGESEFVDLSAAEQALGLVTQLWNDRAEILRFGRKLEPILPIWDDAEIPDTGGKEWAAGFLAGAQLAGDGWDDLMQDEDMFTWMQPFFVLAHQDNPDPTLRAPAIALEDRDMVLAAMMLAVEKIYDFFAPYRMARARPAMAAAIRHGRMPAKPGRNANCPCGSGLKYKRCCGR